MNLDTKILISILCVLLLCVLIIWFIWLRKKEITFEWEQRPQNLHEWVLWILPTKTWTLFIPMIIVLFSYFTIIGGYQILTIRQNDIKERAQKKIKDEKLRYWNSANNPSLKIGLLRLWENQNDVPDEIWEKYDKEENKSVQIEMVVHPWFPQKIKEKLLYSNNERIRIAAIVNTKNKDESIERLARVNCKNCDYIRASVAKYPKTQTDVLTKMYKDSSYTVLEELSKNVSTPPRILSILSTDSRGAIQIYVADNPNTPIKTLRELADSPNYLVRERVAKNTNSDVETLKSMCKKEKDEFVLNALAQNSKLPADYLSILKKKGFDSVKNIISNRNSKNSNEKKNEDKGPQSKEPSNTMKLEEQVNNAGNIDENKRKKAAMASNIRKDLLIELANDGSEIVRAEVAKNTNASINILINLSNDLRKGVREAVTLNPKTPIKILKRLAVDEERNVREMAIKELISRSQREWNKGYGK